MALRDIPGTVIDVARRGVLGWVVLCGTTGVMIGSALLADPPVMRSDAHRAGLFTIAPTVAGGGSQMATTSFPVSAVGFVADTTDVVTEGCIVVPSAVDRGGGEVRLTTRVPAGAGSQLVIAVDRGHGPDADCEGFRSSELLYRGPLEGLASQDTVVRGIVLADSGDDELTIRVRIERAGGGRSGGSDRDLWIDVQHLATPGR